MKIFYYIFYAAIVLLQYNCSRSNGRVSKKEPLTLSDSLQTTLKMLYNKDDIIIGVEHGRIDSNFIRDSLYRGEKYFSSVNRDTLIAFNTNSDRVYLYMICVNGEKFSDIFNDYVGFISNGRYTATKKIGGEYIQKSFTMRYDEKTLNVLEIGERKIPQTFDEVSVVKFEQLMQSFLDHFVFSRQLVANLLDTVPYRGGGSNVKISLEEIDTNQREHVKAIKGKYAYPDYYFSGKINKDGYIYDIAKKKFDRQDNSDSKQIDEIIRKYLDRKQFVIGRFHHLPVNYELNIRVTFVDE